MKTIASNRHWLQRGMMLMGAIFILLVLSLMGAIGVTLTESANSDFEKALAVEKAYWAAREGLEWGQFHAQAFQSCSNPDATDPGGFSSAQGSAMLPLGAFDSSFLVGCQSFDMIENGQNIRVFNLIATGAVVFPPTNRFEAPLESLSNWLSYMNNGYFVGTPSSATRTLQQTLVIKCTATCPASGS